jgi:hypothetical protein
MALRMKSLRIQGFKAIGDATLHWHPRVNVITGPNNSGKTPTNLRCSTMMSAVSSESMRERPEVQALLRRPLTAAVSSLWPLPLAAAWATIGM